MGGLTTGAGAFFAKGPKGEQSQYEAIKSAVPTIADITKMIKGDSAGSELTPVVGSENTTGLQYAGMDEFNETIYYNDQTGQYVNADGSVRLDQTGDPIFNVFGDESSPI
jgi:hypothetical protein